MRKKTIFTCIENVRERFDREIEQAILRRDLSAAIEALGGKDACARLAQSLEFAYGAVESVTVKGLKR